MSDHLIHAEQIVIGAAMSGAALPHLDPDEFYRPAHGELWRRVHQLVAQSIDPSPAALLASITEKPIPNVDGAYLHTCFSAVPLAESIDHFAGIVRDYADLRAVHQAGQKMAQAATISDGANARSHARRALDDLDLRDAGDSATIGDLLPAVLTEIENGVEPGMATPWVDVNRALVGLRPGTSTVIAGRPGTGKSIIGLQLAEYVARKYGPVLFHSLEMGAHEVTRRLLSLTSLVEFRALNTTASEREWDRIAPVTERLAELPLRIEDQATITVAEIAANARRQARNGLRMLVVDYLQLLTPTDRKLPREQQVAEMSRSLKLLAKDLGIAVVILAQLNRESEKRGDGKPRVSDLRESGSVEQDADVVLLLAREDESPTLWVGIGKNRGGPTGYAELHWDGAHMRVTSSHLGVA